MAANRDRGLGVKVGDHIKMAARRGAAATAPAVEDAEVLSEEGALCYSGQLEDEGEHRREHRRGYM